MVARSLLRAVPRFDPPLGARRLVEIEDGGADEHERREHDPGEQCGQPLCLLGELLERQRNGSLTENREDRQRRQSAEDVREVRPRELDGP